VGVIDQRKQVAKAASRVYHPGREKGEGRERKAQRGMEEK